MKQGGLEKDKRVPRRCRAREKKSHQKTTKKEQTGCKTETVKERNENANERRDEIEAAFQKCRSLEIEISVLQ